MSSSTGTGSSSGSSSGSGSGSNTGAYSSSASEAEHVALAVHLPAAVEGRSVKDRNAPFPPVSIALGQPPKSPPIVSAVQVRVFLAWILVIGLAVAITVLMHEFMNEPPSLYGLDLYLWILFLGGMILAFYVIQVVVSALFGFTSLLGILSWFYHLFNPFKRTIVFIVWIAVSWAMYIVLIDDEVNDESAHDRIPKLFRALIQCGLVFAAARGMLMILQIYLYQPMAERMNKTDIWANILTKEMSTEPTEMKRRKKKSSLADSFINTLDIGTFGIIASLKLVSHAAEIRADGMHGLTPRLPYSSVADKDLLARESQITAISLFRTLLVAHKFVNSSSASSSSQSLDSSLRSLIGRETVIGAPGTQLITERDVLAYCNDNKYKAHRMWEDLDVKMKGALTIVDVEESMELLFKERADLINNIDGRQVLVQVTRSLLRVGTIFFVALFLLAAFDVELVSILVPVASLFLAGSFAFSSVLSDFVWSLHLVFFVQAYNLGDWLQLGNDSTVLVVTKVSIMSTYTVDLDGIHRVFPNGKIAKGEIVNLTRGQHVFVSFKYELDGAVSIEDLAEIRSGVREFINGHRKMFTGKFAVAVTNVSTDAKCEVICRASINAAFSDRAYYLKARDMLHFAFMEAVRDVDVDFGADLKVKTLKIE